MQLVLTGKNFVISDRIREYVEKKVGKLDRYLPDIDEAHVEITEERTKSAKDRKIVQITLRANGAILRAEERSEAIYACIDTAVDKIHRQIIRYKGKRLRRWQGNNKKQRQEVVEMQEMIPEVEPELLEALSEEPAGKIVRVKRFVAHPMNEEEAVEQMELLGHDFFVFYNADLGRLNVIYRRKDGNYGLLDPELS
ncbi:MAG: ribosome-associated translation inhibitor RaiA [Chloroflexi bacterium]|nr:MAG: ribosome-associated translation inhibitor RaiA [Chloroflexota bacterium]